VAAGAGRWSRAAACLLAAVTLAACTGTPEPEPSVSSDSTTASPSPSASVVPGPTADGNRRLTLTTVARVPLPGLLSVDRLALSGSRAVLSGCTVCAPDEAGSLHEVDLRTGRVRQVATSSFESGAVVPSGLDGDRLVWLDVEPVTAQFNGRTRWRLQVLDLRSGRSRTLTAAAAATRRVPPWAVVGGGQVAWQEWSGEALAGPVRVADLRTGEVRLVRDLPGPLGAVGGGAVFYVGPAAPDGEAADVGNIDTPADAFALPLPGGPPRALSATRDVGSVTTDGRTAVWTTPRGRPTTVWAGRVEGGGGAARVVYRGVTTERAVVRDAVAVLTSVDAVVEVAPLEGGPRITVPDVPLADAGLAADGTRLAWVAAPGRDVPVDRQRPLELVVVEVR
jgi:hypothetical protein